MDGPVVWESGLDGKFKVRVIMEDQDRGDEVPHLQIFQGEELIYDKETALALGPAFRPDITEIVRWQAAARSFLDWAYA